MDNLRATKSFIVSGYGTVLKDEVFDETLVSDKFSSSDFMMHGRSGDPRQLWEATTDPIFRPPNPTPDIAGGATSVVDFSSLTMNYYNGTSYIDGTEHLEFVSPQSSNGKVVIHDGKLTRVGDIGILTFKLEFDRDQPTRIDFSSLLPSGGEILAVPYPITNNSAHDFADESEISTSIQNTTELHIDRNDDIGAVMHYWYTMMIGGYDG